MLTQQPAIRRLCDASIIVANEPPELIAVVRYDVSILCLITMIFGPRDGLSLLPDTLSLSPSLRLVSHHHLYSDVPHASDSALDEPNMVKTKKTDIVSEGGLRLWAGIPLPSTSGHSLMARFRSPDPSQLKS